jgi:radical SAM superfamily enzyme YgiQ (UPF0313 family)
MNKILLIKPPFFTPWTPPLGIALLKSFMEPHGYSVRCIDLNTDSELWGTHHTYFGALQQLENISINDGYSKLWWILNAHMLAYVNGASPAACSRMLDTIIPLYGIKHDRNTIKTLLPIVDRFFKRLEELGDQFDLTDYGVVGTSTYTTSLAPSLFMLKKLKEKYPHLVTVMGGGIFADDFAPGSYNLDALVTEYPYVDQVVIGEGELLFLKLLQGEFAGKRVVSIADIEGTTVNMADSRLPDFSDLNLEPYYHLTIEGGRSCPFQCKFCSETVQWGEYRKKPMDLFAQQLVDLAEKHGNNAFFLADSLMNPYIGNLADELLKRKANVLYDGYLRADAPVTNRDRVRFWARSGLYRVRLGIESGSAHTLELMGKRTNPGTYSAVLRSLSSAGVRTTTYWVVGYPGETQADFEETLHFVREHHRYIYELEAHPYYFYPQGQVGSEQYPSRSLYPDDVTEIIKFKRWEISDREPTREETFRRLSRFSKFAADLGLPNIYTMAERFQAEDRWQRLHPLTTEIYGRTPASRRVEVSARPVAVLSEEQERQLSKETSDASSVLCYHVLVNETLDTALLRTAIGQLAQHNDVLQMCLGLGRAVLGAEGPDSFDNALSVYDGEAGCTDEIGLKAQQIVEALAAEMRPEPGASVRAAVIGSGARGSSHLLVLAHRAIADGKSMGFLVEDLFRIYEQLSERKEITLHPVQKRYTELVGELVSPQTAAVERKEASDSRARRPAMFDSQEQGRTRKSCTRALDVSLAEKLFSTAAAECGLRADQMLAGVLLKSLAGANGGAPLGVDITVDYRTTDARLARTAGPLTFLVPLPPEIVRDDSLLGLYEMQRVSQNSLVNRLKSRASTPGPGDQEKKVLLNWEYWIDEPWLGGDKWVPQGFVVSENGPAPAYLLEIAPVLLREGVALRLNYYGEPDANDLVQAVTSGLAQAVEELASHCNRYRAARQFWLTEFGNAAARSVVEEMQHEERQATGEGWASLYCAVQPSVLDSLRKEFQTDMPAALLAAYGVLLSRLSGRQDLAVVASIGKTGVLPLRIHPSWDKSFGKFIQDVRQRIAQAIEHQLYTSRFLTQPLQAAELGLACPAFDIGYIFCAPEQDQDGNKPEQALELYPEIGEKVGLVLKVIEQGTDLAACFFYKPSLLGSELVGEISSHLASILAKVSKSPDIPLGYIVLGKKKRA